MLCLIYDSRQTLRRNNFGKINKEILHGDTVKSTIRHVCQIFRIDGFNGPGSDKTRVTNIKLTRIFHGYKKSGPNTLNQCTLPLDVIKLLYFNNLSKKNKYIGLLATGALFFGMCSCEYLGVKTNNTNKQNSWQSTIFNSLNKIEGWILPTKNYPRQIIQPLLLSHRRMETKIKP